MTCREFDRNSKFIVLLRFDFDLYKIEFQPQICMILECSIHWIVGGRPHKFNNIQ